MKRHYVYFALTLSLMYEIITCVAHYSLSDSLKYLPAWSWMWLLYMYVTICLLLRSDDFVLILITSIMHIYSNYMSTLAL